MKLIGASGKGATAGGAFGPTIVRRVEKLPLEDLPGTPLGWPWLANDALGSTRWAANHLDSGVLAKNRKSFA